MNNIKSFTLGILVGFAATVAVYCAFRLYGFTFKSPSDLGSIGDFFGGILNPIIAAAALYYLIKSINMQKSEIVKIDRRVKKQNKKNKILALEENLRNTSDSIKEIEKIEIKVLYEKGIKNEKHSQHRTQNLKNHLEILITSDNKELDSEAIKSALEETKELENITNRIIPFYKSIVKIKKLDPGSQNAESLLKKHKELINGLKIMEIIPSPRKPKRTSPNND